MAQIRATWRTATRKAAALFEETRHKAAEIKRLGEKIPKLYLPITRSDTKLPPLSKIVSSTHRTQQPHARTHELPADKMTQ